MPRPHIEFIQSQVLPFRKGLFGGARDDVACRILSQDGESGASSTMLRYPPGWHRSEPEVLDADEEFFVLEGAIEINGCIYGKHAYAHLPAGYLRRSARSAGGAVVLTFFSAEPHATPRDTPGVYNPERLVEHIDTRVMPGQTGERKHMNSGDFDPTGTVHKKLFRDPESGDMTWLIGIIPYWSSDRIEVHPVVEEEFAVAGDICFPMGVMRDGGYFWRPPGIEHGPFATWGGTLHLCRGKGGPYATEWRASDSGPNWTPAYDPILPDDYRAYLDGAVSPDHELNY